MLMQRSTTGGILLVLLILTWHSLLSLPYTEAKSLEKVSSVSESLVLGKNLQNILSPYVSALGEAPLGSISKTTATNVFCLRFICLPSFYHPMCIRVERSVLGKAQLFVKQCSGTGGYNPGTLSVNRKIVLKDKDYIELKKKVLGMNIFNQPINQEKMNIDDGSSWIFELNDAGRYHLVSTEGGGSLRDLGNYLLKIGGILPSHRQYY